MILLFSLFIPLYAMELAITVDDLPANSELPTYLTDDVYQINLRDRAYTFLNQIRLSKGLKNPYQTKSNISNMSKLNECILFVMKKL